MKLQERKPDTTLKDQPFRIEERTVMHQQTKEYDVWSKPAYGERYTLDGVIRWHTAYYGYVFDSSSFGAMSVNVLTEIVQLINDLNAGNPNKHISLDNNPF